MEYGQQNITIQTITDESVMNAPAADPVEAMFRSVFREMNNAGENVFKTGIIFSIEF